MMLREIRLDVILLVVITVIVAIFVLNATAESGPLKTGELGVPPDWEASQEITPVEATPEATIEAAEDIEATVEPTEEPAS